MSGPYILSSGYNEGQVSLYNESSGEHLTYQCVCNFKRCAIDATHSLIAMCLGERVVITDTAFNILQDVSLSAPGYSVAFRTDLPHVIVGDERGAITVINHSTGEKVLQRQVHADNVRDLIWLPISKLIATVSWDRTAAIIDPHDLNPRQTFSRHTSYGVCLIALKDEQTIVTGAYDGGVKIWSVTEGTCMRTIPRNKAAYSMAINSVGTIFITAYDDGSVVIRSCDTFEDLHVWKLDHGIGAISFFWVPDHVLVGVKDVGVVSLNYLTGRTTKEYTSHKGYVFTLASTQHFTDPKLAGIQFLDLPLETI